jgi:hypothetical protein
MDIDSKTKVDVLLKLLEQNRKSVDWLKDFDFKIAYYSLALYLAAIAWLTGHPPKPEEKWVWYSADAIVAILGSVFLVRNSARHKGFNQELNRIWTGLRLTEPKFYSESGEAICNAPAIDFAFYLGRALYVLYVVASAIVFAILIHRLKIPIPPEAVAASSLICSLATQKMI